MQGLKLRKTDISRIVGESLQGLRIPEAVTLDIRISVDDTAVWIDHEGIRKALTDLETNALEAMPQGGCLTITVKGDPAIVSISIRDTGCGIPAVHMDELFTPFFTTKPVGEGTGLGLPAAYGIIKAHGGELTIQSNADAAAGPTGTTVHISLPRRLILPDANMKLVIHEDD